MTSFTIFYNAKIDKFTAVYDFNLPTVTGIGTKKEWQAVLTGGRFQNVFAEYLSFLLKWRLKSRADISQR